MKEVKGWELSNKNNKVVTKEFSGTTTDDMKSFQQPTISNDSKCIVLNCSTNDLKQSTSVVEIGEKILELAAFCKLNRNNILISGIVPRRDKLKGKATQVNKFLKNECSKRNICFINSSNINPRYHCDQSGIHLIKAEPTG